jgi:hypothetical protein
MKRLALGRKNSSKALRGLGAQMENQDFAVCVKNTGFAASLEPRKLYLVVHDSDAEANDLIRVIDESGEDYVYPL